MIETDKIQDVIEGLLKGTGIFLVEIKTKPAGTVSVFIDREKGITIEDCRMISRKIESEIGEETGDIELVVSSPGLDQPFRVAQQYEKYIMKDVEVVKFDGKKIEGRLIAYDGKEMILEITDKKKPGVYRKKPADTKQMQLNITEIKLTKAAVKI